KFEINDPVFPTWRKVFSNEDYVNVFSAVRKLPMNSFLIAQSRDSIEYYTENNQLAFVKVDENGNKLWDREYYYNYPITWFTFNLTDDGGWIAALPVVKKGANFFFVVKYDSTGCDSTLAYCELVTGL